MNLFRRAYGSMYRRWRIMHYRLLSRNIFTGVVPVMSQPILFNGKGAIHFDGQCIFGWPESPGFYSTYAYIEARENSARVVFGEGSHFNNNFHVIARDGEIRLGSNLRIGMNCSILNSDFHNLDPALRNVAPFPDGDIEIGNNVFFGNNVTVLKGAKIGDNVTIGSGSLVTSDIPANSIAAGIPARIIKQIRP